MDKQAQGAKLGFGILACNKKVIKFCNKTNIRVKMIKSNIIGEDRNIYMSYLNEYYKHKWTMNGIGDRACPVIAIDTIKKLFGIDVDIKSVPYYMMNTDGVNAQFGIINPVVNLQQLKALAHTYKLSFKKSYVDLVVAHELYLYDLHKSDLLERKPLL